MPDGLDFSSFGEPVVAGGAMPDFSSLGEPIEAKGPDFSSFGEPVDVARETSASQPGAIARGFVSGALEQNPSLTAETLEGLSYLAPEQFKDTFASGAADMRALAALSPEAYKPRAKSLFEGEGVGDALTWAGETFGQGMASTLPALVTGTVGAAVGSRLAGRPGAIGGGLAGAAISSAVQNYGDLYKELKDEKVPPEQAAEWAFYATPPIVALDTASLGPIITRLGGAGKVRQELARSVARRIAEEAAKGTGREGITEAAQQVIEEATVSLAADKPFWTVKTAEKVTEAGVGGALVGGPMGAVGGVVPDRTRTIAPPEAIRRELQNLTPEDRASPIPDQLIAEGRAVLAEAAKPLPEGAVPAETVIGTEDRPLADLLAERFPDQPAEAPPAIAPAAQEAQPAPGPAQVAQTPADAPPAALLAAPESVQPEATPEPRRGPYYDEFRNLLPKDAQGEPDVTGAGSRIIAEVAGQPKPWSNLTLDERTQAIDRVRALNAPATQPRQETPAPAAASAAPARPADTLPAADTIHLAPKPLLERAIARALIPRSRVTYGGTPAMTRAEIKGQTAEEAQRLQQAITRETEIGQRRSAAARGRKTGPLDLLQFIASRGGIRDPGGDLRSQDLHRLFLPGFGKLVRPTGLHPDMAREAAQEAGYIRSNDPNATTSINDLFDAIDRNARGQRVYSENDRAAVDARQANEADAEIAAAIERAVDDASAAAEIELSATERADAIALVSEGISPEDAIERIAIQSGEAQVAANAAETGEEPPPNEPEAQPAATRGEAPRAGAQPEAQPGQPQGIAPAGPKRGTAGPVQEGEGGPSPADVAPFSLPRQQRPTVDQTPQGVQHVVPGAERLTQAEMDRRKIAERQAQEKIAPKVGQNTEGEGLFDSGARKQGDLFSLTPRAADALPAVIGDLRARLDALGLKDVAVRLVDTIRSVADGKATPAQGRYFRKLVDVALNSADPATWVLDHETIHALRDLGVFKSAEWSTLSRAAQSDTARMAEIRDRYAGLDLTPEQLTEEAVADMFATWRAGRSEPRGFIRTAFERIANFLRAMGEALRGHGFDSVDSVFGRIERGTVGARERAGEVTGQPMYHAAFHGSPHDFDEFDTGKIGTGEGAQSYGWGLYFSGKKEVAEYYRQSLSGPDARAIAAVIEKNLPPDAPAGLIRALAGIKAGQPHYTAAEVVRLAFNRNSEYRNYIDENLGLLQAAVGKAREARAGRLYRVDLAPKEHEYLDWDKRLSEQSEKVRTILNEKWWAHPDAHANQTGEQIYRQIQRQFDKAPSYARDTAYGQHAASLALHEAGIPGIRYLDQGSRGYQVNLTVNGKPYHSPGARFDSEQAATQYAARMRNEGFGAEIVRGDTHNYVIFDASHVKIEEKFSLRRQRPYPNTEADRRARDGLFGTNFNVASEAVWSFMQDKNRSLLARIGTTAKAASDAARQKLQDRMLVARRIQEAIQVARDGAPLPESQNVYLAEELYHGRTGKRLDDFRSKSIEPLVEAIDAEGLSLAQVEDYLYARHAEERNAKIAKINPKLQDGGSGMTNAEAKDVLDRYRKDGLTPKLERIAAKVDAIARATIETRVEGGLIDQKTAKLWQDTYKHYVPLKGFAEVSLDEPAMPSRPRTGKGFDIRGQESQRALGRKSRAGDILANVISAHEEAIVRAEKNKVGQTFLHMVMANPKSDLWEVDKVEYQPRLNRKTGMVEQAPDPRYTLKDNVLAVKVEGKVYHVTIHHQALARAMKNIGAETANGLLRTMQRFNRWLAFVNTSANPEFVVSNFFRDLQTAGVNLQGVEPAKKMTARILADVPQAIRGAFKGIRGDEESAWGKWFQEYAKAGGKTEFFSLDDLETKRKRIDRLLKDLNPSQLGRVRILARDAERLIQDVNGAVENGIRLSTYANLRKAGATERQAASVAKNLTVNFNRKGEWAGTAAALFLFYNASIQGSVRLIHALKSPRVQKLVGGIVVTFALLDILNGFLSPDDDDGDKKYDKIAKYTKDHNLIVVNPWAGKGALDVVGVKIPLPYGYNVFAVAGYKMGEAIRSALGMGRKVDPWKAAADIATTALESFNPVSNSSGLLSSIVPTALKPFYELSVNRNFMDKPIKPLEDPYGVKKPESERYFRTVSPPSKFIAQELNELTGGNKVRPGAVDISPEAFDHFAQFVTGGTGTFVQRTSDTFYRAVSGEGKEVRWSEIPFARRLVEGNSAYYTQQRFYEIRDAGKLAEAEVKMFAAARDLKGLAQARREHLPELQAAKAIEQMDRAMRDLRAQRNAIEANKALADDVKKDRLDQIDARRDALMTRVITIYNAAVKRGPAEPAVPAATE